MSGGGQGSGGGGGWLVLIAIIVVLGIIIAAVEGCLETVGLKDEEGEAFARVCEERGGRVTQEDVTCEIIYQGQSYEIPIDNLEHRFDAEKARENRRECRINRRFERQDAEIEAGLDGRIDRFVYHPKTGVCEQRENEIPINKKKRRPEPAPAPEPEPQESAPAENCAPGYSPCVPPFPPDVDCPDVDGPVAVTGSDPHELDADGDGSACE